MDLNQAAKVHRSGTTARTIKSSSRTSVQVSGSSVRQQSGTKLPPLKLANRSKKSSN
jgi:hypothetical protein